MPFCPQALLSRNSIRSNEIFSPTIRQKEGGVKLGRNLSSFIRQRHYLGLARLSQLLTTLCDRKIIEISKSKAIYFSFLSSAVANLNSSVVNSYFPVSATVWITVAYVVIFIFGFFGNICIIYIVVSRKQMRTKFNFLVVNMAVGDLLVSLFVMPFEVRDNFPIVEG